MTINDQNPTSSPVKPRCPRCGYDQRGIVATWTDACPLTGTCAECGLVFRWVEVLQPRRFEPQWCVEFAPKRRTLPRTVLTTFLRSFWPWVFWSRLQMSHRIRWRRLIAYVLLLHLLMFSGYVAEQAIVAVRVRWAVGQEFVRQQQTIPARIQRMLQTQQSPEWTRMTASERRLNQRYVQSLRQAMNAPDPINHSYAAAIYEAVVFPLGSTSRGTITHAVGVSPYLPPDSLHEWLSNQAGRWGATVSTELIAMNWGVALWIAVSFPLLPLGFICLPISRRRAKVRWGHIARVTAYGFLIPASTGFALAVLTGLAFAFQTPIGNSFSALGALLVWGFAPAAVIVWWAVAIKRYMRLPHGWAVALLLGVMAALLAMVLVAIIDGAYS